MRTSSRSNRGIAAVLLALMLTMAVAGLMLALGTWKSRESRHPRPVFEASAQRPYLPPEWPALGYLPVDTNVAAGIDVQALHRDRLTARLLEPPVPRLLARVFSHIDEQTALKPDAIDHIVLGTTLTDEIPQLTLVVQTHRPYRQQEVQKLLPQKPLMQHKRPLFRLAFAPLGGGFLWCADERTLVMVARPDAAKIEDMDRIPAVPRKGADGLAPALRDMLETRLRHSFAWLAGTLPQERVAALLDIFATPPSRQVMSAASLDTFALGLELQEDVTLTGAFKARNGKGARAWREYLDTVAWPQARNTKIDGPSVEGPEKNWVNLQVRAEPGGIRALLDQRWFDFSTPKKER